MMLLLYQPVDKDYTPPELSAMILQKMKQTAEEYLGRK